jgi:serine/threonine-protein kinase
VTGAPLAPGCRIGNYELLYELGRGAIGETFAARASGGPHDGQIVCVKVLAQEFRGSRSAERDAAVRYLRHEARVVSQLDHPNIARLLDSGGSGDVWYLAFELVEGVNLSDVLAHGPLGAYHVLHLGLELSKALACAHERDVLHRDIKPSNILISTSGDVKLVDFGLAKLNAGAASQFSQHVGTPRYFSPEQLRGDALTPATDIYAVGLVLFELLTGSHPFHHADIDLFRRNVLQGLPQRTLRGKSVPADLVEIIERCIQLDSTKRFADGTALHDALRAAVDQCSRAGDGGLGDLSVLGLDDGGPDSQMETRLGDLADRVADIRDDPADVRTRFTADPMAPYGHATRVTAPEETAAETSRSLAFQTESIMGDLSRIARAVTAQRSSGLDPARSHRSGVRPVDEATPLLRRHRARTPNGDQPADQRNAPPAAQRETEQTPGAAQSRLWMRSAPIAALCLLLAALAAGIILQRPNPESRTTATPSMRMSPAAAEATSSAEPTPAGERPTEREATPPQKEEREQPARTDDIAESAPAPSDRGATSPAPAQQKAKSARPSRAKAAELVSVTIGTIPYGEVTVDGKRAGSAPVVVKLAPGSHRIVARSQQLRRVETILVSPETNHVVLDLRR